MCDRPSARCAAICPPAPAQYAALAAFDAYPECDAHVQRYAHNRGVLLNGLRRLGIDRLAPADGAFYVYADIGHLTDDSIDFGARLLDRAGIAAAPGVDFDVIDGHRSIRFSFAGSTATIEGALDALERALAAGYAADAVLAQEKWLPRLGEVLGNSPAEVLVVSADLAEQVTGFAVHRAVFEAEPETR